MNPLSALILYRWLQDVGRCQGILSMLFIHQKPCDTVSEVKAQVKAQDSVSAFSRGYPGLLHAITSGIIHKLDP